MNNIISKVTLLFILVFHNLSVSAQEYIYERKVVQIQAPQKFYLNSGGRSYLGGKSRQAIRVDLPPNTIDWYYSFVTSAKEDQADRNTNSLRLTDQLAGFVSKAANLASGAGTANFAANLIMTPSGGESCDVIVLDESDSDIFLNKGKYTYYKDVSRTNFNSGTVHLKGYIEPTYYLGFRNPTVTTGFYVTVEVSAIVKVKKPKIEHKKKEMKPIIAKEEPASRKVEEPENVRKAKLYGNLAWRQFEKGDYEKCLELSRKALEFDNNQAYIHFNIGLSLLALNKSTDALDEYVTAISMVEKSNNPKYYLNSAIEGIDNLEKLKSKLDGSSDIKELIEEEIKKYN